MARSDGGLPFITSRCAHRGRSEPVQDEIVRKVGRHLLASFVFRRLPGLVDEPSIGLGDPSMGVREFRGKSAFKEGTLRQTGS